MRTDYNTLTWGVGPDSRLGDLLDVFVDGGYDGVRIRVQREAEIENLDFLAQLPGLRYVEVNGTVQDDSREYEPGEAEDYVAVDGSLLSQAVALRIASDSDEFTLLCRLRDDATED